MRRYLPSAVQFVALLLTLGVQPVRGQQPEFVRTQDVVYGRKFGTALTLDVFQPRDNANGAAVVLVISGGWFSAHEAIRIEFVAEPLRRGYTVFAVVHGSQPRFTIPEAIADMQRSVRFIRHGAEQWKIDPERIGVTGLSAGGHLSLMQGAAGDMGNASAEDAIERTSSRVQAVACFFPPTDFLNYGEPGNVALGRSTLSGFRAPFDFHELNPETRRFERIEDEARILDIGRQISPINHVSADDPPTLIIHGDADKLVPIQQAESFIAKLKEAGAIAELVARPGASHGWPMLLDDLTLVYDWFDKHLAAKPSP